MRKRLQRAAAIGMAAILCIQNAQFGLTTFADELSDFARMEGIMNAQAMRVTPANAVENLSGSGELAEDRDTGENGEIKENPDGNSEGQENEQDDIEKASDSDAKKEENSGIGNTVKKDETKKFQIQSFEWGDPEEYPKGEPMIASVTEEVRASFEELTEALPQEIRAIVSEEEKAEDSATDENEEKLQDDSSREEIIPIVSWTCPEYKIDEDGKWPLSGEFTFEAELPGEYEVAESCDAVEMTVILDGGVELLSDQRTPIIWIKENDTEVKNIYWDETEKKFTNSSVSTALSESFSGNGYTVTYDADNKKFNLNLQGAQLTELVLISEKWQINVSNDSAIKGTQDQEDALYINETVSSVTINFENNSKLSIFAGECGISTYSDMYLTGTGTLQANAGGKDWNKDSPGITVGSGKKFEVLDQVSLIVGTVDAHKGEKIQLYEGPPLKFASTGNSYLNNGISAVSGTIKIEQGANLTIKEKLEFDEQCTLINSGNLQLDGSFKNLNGGTSKITIQNNGTLSGTMDLGACKINTNIAVNNKAFDVPMSNSCKDPGIDLNDLNAFTVTPNDFPLEYQLTTGDDTSPEGAVIKNGKLKVQSPGHYYIKAKSVVSSDQAGFYKQADSDTVAIWVKNAELSTEDFVVEEYRGLYDGEPHDIATVRYNSERVEFLGFRKVNDSNSAITPNCPQITNVSENDGFNQTWCAVFKDKLNNNEVTSSRIWPIITPLRFDYIKNLKLEYQGKELKAGDKIQYQYNGGNPLPSLDDITIS